MRRGRFGILLLLAILILSLLGQNSVKDSLQPIAEDMGEAAQAVLSGDWQKTAALAGEARAAWEKQKLKLSGLTQQQAVQEIDSLYDQMEVFLQTGEQIHCGAFCEALKNELQALLKDQALFLKNLI